MAHPDPFAAIADPNRRFLLEELRRAPRTVNELSEGLPISRPAASSPERIPPYSASAGTSKGNTAISLRISSTAFNNRFEPRFAQP